MKPHGFCLALLSVIAIAASVPAQAGTLTRSFVSSAGVDSNPCTLAQPCATFNAAYNAVAMNGIIAALDPGKYSSLTISMPVTINGNGWAAITAPASGNGITINIAGGTGNVILNGIEIDGAGAGYNGIAFQSGASLTVSDCVVKDFVDGGITSGAAGNGIYIAPTSGTAVFTIVNTVAVNNQYYGISYWPQTGNATVTGTIDHVFAAHNTTGGIVVDTATAGAGTATVSISNSVASNSITGNGIYSNGTGVTTTIDSDQISNNAYGVNVASATVLLSRSVITQNSQYGISNSGTIDTFQDNRYSANGHTNGMVGTLTPASVD